MAAFVDLHIHSHKSSDGELSPAEIMALAGEKGLVALSITDHDTLAAYPEALVLGEEAGVEVIPGIELTTGFKGREFHLLCPFVQWSSPLMVDLVADVASRRIEEAGRRVAGIRALGMDLEWADVEEEAGSFPPVGVTIALAYLKKARKKGDPVWRKYFDEERGGFAAINFYNDYFKRGKPAYVPRLLIALEEALSVVRRAGAVPVLAHPGAGFVRAAPEDLEELKGSGLEGLEVYSTYHDEDMMDYYLGLADKFDLVPTAGSDFHGSVKPHIPFGSLTRGDYSMVERLKTRRPE
jgi:predicted metal-dependent phosphoesterase TrpH